jgi:GNAT superfamily N-acetyltransferase
MNIEFFDNQLTAEEYLRVHQELNYDLEPKAQVEKALEKSLFTVTVKDNGRIIGMGRLVGDGAMYCYIQDVRVIPAYQNHGIGRAIVSRLVEAARQNGISNTGISVGLTSAVGKEPFYEKLGFTALPGNDMGSGMYLDLDI